MTDSKGKAKFKAFMSGAGEALRRCGAAFADALYPTEISCDICLSELRTRGRYRVCAKCLEELPYVGDKICLNCGAPLSDESDYCDRCRNTESSFKLCRAPFEYRDLAVKMIHDLKFGGKQYMAQTLAAFMTDEFLKDGMSAEIVCFVPMTPKEEKKRGFNQAELLASEIAERLNMPLLPALVKRKDTTEQKALSARDRAKNLEGAYECVVAQVKKRSVLLVDDVFTTGATSNECAKALLKAGAREVSVLTAAITRQKMSFERDDRLVSDDKK